MVTVSPLQLFIWVFICADIGLILGEESQVAYNYWWLAKSLFSPISRDARSQKTGFWAARGKRSAPVVADEDDFFAYRGKKDNDEEDDSDFWAYRGKKDVKEEKRNDFWAQRGKREPEDGFWAQRGKRDPEDGFWAQRGKRNGEDGFWAQRGKKDDESFDFQETGLVEVTNEKRNLKPNGLFSGMGKRNIKPNGLFSGLGKRNLKPNGLFNGIGKRNLKPNGIFSGIKRNLKPNGLFSGMHKRNLKPNGLFNGIGKRGGQGGKRGSKSNGHFYRISRSIMKPNGLFFGTGREKKNVLKPNGLSSSIKRENSPWMPWGKRSDPGYSQFPVSNYFYGFDDDETLGNYQDIEDLEDEYFDIDDEGLINDIDAEVMAEPVDNDSSDDAALDGLGLMETAEEL